MDTFEAVSKFVLRVVVLRKGGKLAIPRAIFVSNEPSPANLAVMNPADMVEKNP